MIQEWIRNNPKASICTAEGVNQFKYIANFQDYHGLPEFRNAVANFMSEVRGGRVRFDPDRILMSGGATRAHEVIMFCLADAGDAFLVPSRATGANQLIMFCLVNDGDVFLVPSPYYPAYVPSLSSRLFSFNESHYFTPIKTLKVDTN
ncbi:1-aminocyclopropane-1-carboxylate synthase 1 [Glycine soja]|uniref:1-aminocyclopropane-1-carboxylate synthase 1 n=1 Tax=Glycine soja TaxID=3848 RepID=A0A0B2NX68_GLYSO|nr:1-aminocyclopropane-1-carboxylate synthase 1 [Glycine soja]